MNTIDSKVLADLGVAANPQPKKSELGQDAFLKLMITQLQNQDPFKPMENGEFLTQIAQFSSVTGIDNLNKSFSSVASALYSNQALQASALVGRSVLVPGDQMKIADGGEMKGAVELPASSDKVTVTILDRSGQPIRQLDLGIREKGMVEFAWDGRDQAGSRVAEGTYKIVANASVGGQMTALNGFIQAPVESVTLLSGGQGITLNLGGVGERSFSDIKKIM
ncbi:MAG: flagellar hook capping protein [Gammaproteobacteria bacterium]|nr:MAG: flagellar hook capping protein [Gammaproteobacteria bacterium]TND06698.1 MAG: flagellar hook capping protein [Gammaproteobacteria bacterium]